MKRLSIWALVLVLVLSVFVGCAADKTPADQGQAAPVTEEESNPADVASGTDLDTDSESEAKDWKIAMVAGGAFGDNGMNDAFLAAMKLFTEQSGIEVTSVEVNDFSDHESYARQFGEEGYDMVLMAGTVSDIMPAILEDYPNTHYVLNKGTVDGYENCTSIQFDEPAAGFVGGAFAVMMSEYLGGGNKVGWIGGMRIADLELCRYCFSAGAAYAGGEANVAYVGDFSDISKAKELALQMYKSGITLIQAFAGGAANGVYQAAESMPEGYYAMGAATGQYDLSPDRILASHIIKTDEYFATVCQEFVDGTLASGIVKVGLESGATGIRLSPYLGDLIPQEIQDSMAEIEAKLISGEIVPPTTEEALNDYLASLN